MIYDRLDAIERYRGIAPMLDRAIEFVLTHDLKELPLGRTDIEGEALYVTVSRGDLRLAQEAPWESHAVYTDLQIGLSDGESIEYLPVTEVTGWGEWLDGDIRFTKEPVSGAALPLNQGRFMILFPWDAHKPGIGEGAGYKAVFKVQI